VRSNNALACFLLAVLGCAEQQAPAGFESPRATVDSLFRAYGVQDISQAEARRRLQARERFDLLDPNLFRSCFSDWQGEHDQALGGFVFGQLVAAKDDMTIEQQDQTARVRLTPSSADLQPIVLVQSDGAWRIDLRQSVPPKVRQSLYEVYRRARRAERSVH
jgi:hypothetical protein